jgi:hypothetical protein
MDRYAAPLIVSIVDLKRMVNDGKAFSQEIDNIEFMANGNSVILISLDKLKPYSKGIKTEKYLQDQFSKLINEVVQESRKPADDARWIDKVTYNLTKNIIIRKVDNSRNPSSLENVIINAESYINDGDYKDAIYELKKLNEKEREFFNQWVVDAAEYVYVNSVLDGLMNYMRDL